jgi:hypothetical protein
MSDPDIFETIMIRYNLVLIVVFLFLSGKVRGQEFVVKKDLQPDWLIRTEKGYHNFDASEESANTIYFSINPSTYRGDYLLINSPNEFSIFLNSSLLLDQVKQVTFPMDSLKKLTSANLLFIAIHLNHKIGRNNLSTTLCSKVKLTTRVETPLTLRADTSFRDFVVSVVMALLIFLVGVVRLNPKLSSDYFSIAKIFSLRESEDDQFYYRITSTNILFYLLTSMLFALFFLIVGNFLEQGGEFNVQGARGYWEYLLLWGKVSLMVLGLLFIKIIVTFVIALLFGAREVAGFHFLNFIRLSLVSVGLLTLVLVFYFLLHGQRVGVYNFLYLTFGWILIGWIILFFLKLINRVRHSVFHLFSYICATEIIPVLVIIKILYLS